MKQQITTYFGSLFKLCPYFQLWQTGKMAIKERQLTAFGRQGSLIALLGLCCPFFWVALFRGASRGELILHAMHSGIFIIIGVVLMLLGVVVRK